ncbi:hypothetical protein DH2020_006586 [Rehmannia glutinosa]|uniref:C2 domain-containing protein n=1 Tax=Rehmannia glutinosa TaxID=99300 RepID=A0ABR0XJ93_REHGL
MSISGIQGQLLEVTVVGCSKLKDTEWISRQDPYVCLEYASNKFRTRTCTDGGKNPTFQEKFVFTLIEGLREFSVVVWNSNTLTFDDFIGTGKIQLQKVLSQGYDDSAWPLQDKRGRHAGEVRLIMHYANASKPATSHAPSAAPSAPPYAGTPAPQVPLYSAPPPGGSYPPTSYPPPPLYPSYAPNAGYPPSPYHQPPAYPPTYPPTSSYPPHSAYPPPPHDPYYYPPSPYPPPPYPPPPF